MEPTENSLVNGILRGTPGTFPKKAQNEGVNFRKIEI
jgi:hypothetical protein